MLEEQTERELLFRIRENDDPRALERLVASHLRLVYSTAKRFSRVGVPMDDLVSEGSVGLLEAARRFDPEKGARFATYASWWVRAKVRRFALANRRIVGAPSTRNGRKAMAKIREAQQRILREEGETPSRERLAEELAVSPDDIAHAESALGARDVPLSAGPESPVLQLISSTASPEEQASQLERAERTRDLFRSGLSILDPRERKILEKRLLSEKTETLAELGESLGLSRERVRQIELGAKAKMREVLMDLVA